MERGKGDLGLVETCRDYLGLSAPATREKARIERNMILAGRYFLARGTHDLETREHSLNISGLSSRKSVM